MKTIRCIICATEFSFKETENVNACPKCGATSIPCIISQDVELKINWHELRILTIWATNYADQANFAPESKRALDAIIARLEKQRPEGAAPLTLMGELKELQETMPGITVEKEGKIILKPKKVM